jgi:hypothetical protein
MKLNSLIVKAVKACLPYGILRLCIYLRQKHKKSYRKVKMSPLIHCAKSSPRFIVTLTSYGHRVKEKAPYAVRSLLSQSERPDKIVLWLTHGTKIPPFLKKWEMYGLEIRFCEDMKSHTKLIPALIEFPDDALITADDDIFYHSDWFKMLKEAYLAGGVNNSGKIYCHRAHEICLDENKNIIPYNEWRSCVRTIEHERRIFATGVGGILYPPHSFSNEVLNAEKFLRLAPSADDVWFWAMAKHNGKSYALVKNGFRYLTGIGQNNDGLDIANVGNMKNDEQIKNVIKEYPDVYGSIL